MTQNIDRSAQPIWDGPLSSIVEESPSTEVIASYIDWSPFFWTWEFKGKFPTIFEHRDYGQEARKLYDDALVILDRLIKDERLNLRGVWSMMPAVATGDDIKLETPEGPQTLFGMRQQKNTERAFTVVSPTTYLKPLSRKANWASSQLQLVKASS